MFIQAGNGQGFYSVEKHMHTHNGSATTRMLVAVMVVLIDLAGLRESQNAGKVSYTGVAVEGVSRGDQH